VAGITAKVRLGPESWSPVPEAAKTFRLPKKRLPWLLVTASPAYMRVLAQRYSGGLYLHWNFWCNVQDPVQPAFCRTALAMGPADVVSEYRERDQRFAFYRLHVGTQGAPVP